jgi:Protein of unknown function (DUF1761)
VQPPHLNGLAILVAALLRFVIGFIWWSPPLFGGAWNAPELRRRMPWAVAASVVTALLMAFVLAHAVAYAGAQGPAQGALVGFWNWLGFVATVTLMVTFSQPKPLQTFLIQNGYQALSIIAMGALLASWV